MLWKYNITLISNFYLSQLTGHKQNKSSFNQNAKIEIDIFFFAWKISQTYESLKDKVMVLTTNRKGPNKNFKNIKHQHKC